VRRLALPFLFALGVLAAGGFSAAVVASTVATSTGTTSTGTTTGTTTTGTTTTGTTTTTPTPQPIATGVTIAGVAVGGLTASQAETAVFAAANRAVDIRVAGHRFRVVPSRLGAVPQVHGAVRRALTSPPDTTLSLKVDVRVRMTKAYVSFVGKKFDRKPVDSVMTLRNLRPWISADVPGHTLDRARAVSTLLKVLQADGKGPVRLHSTSLPATVTRASFGPVIVIRRGSHHLYLYNGMKTWRDFPVAVGQPIYPTPLGHYAIQVMWRNPWWYPPASPWAAGLKPIPPGPGNPLGTRWMGLTAPGVGIHGTPDPASVGYSASHGCIRMYIADAEWLFAHVRVGTQVFIVSA
jgi:lipoprotein-anchoring transpeptidase ErfK/SrfK